MFQCLNALADEMIKLAVDLQPSFLKNAFQNIVLIGGGAHEQMQKFLLKKLVEKNTPFVFNLRVADSGVVLAGLKELAAKEGKFITRE